MQNDSGIRANRWEPGASASGDRALFGSLRADRVRNSRWLRGTTALLLAFAAACSAAEKPPTPDSVTPAEVAALLEAGDTSFILDVRTPEEFAAGHIPGAINIPHTELPARLDELSNQRDAAIIVTCERGSRARSASVVLSAGGFGPVRELAGHMSAWREGGFPVE